MNERIKKLRKALDLTQQEFSNCIGCSRNLVANYEIGNRNPSSSVINNICKTFNVSETWLRTGDGEMFIQKKPQPLDELLSTLLDGESVTDEDRILVKNFLELPEASRKAVIEFVRKCTVELSVPDTAGQEQPSADSDAQERTGTDIMSELAELKRQNEEIKRQNEEIRQHNQELSAKVAAMQEEDDLGRLPDTGNLA